MGMDYVPGRTFLHRLHPISKLAYTLAVTIPTMVSTDPIVLFLVLLSIVAFFHFAKIPWGRLIELLKLVIPASILYVVIGLAIYGTRPNYTFYFYLIPQLKLVPVTLESLVYQIGVVLKFLIVVISFRLILLITPVTDLVRSISMLKFPPSVATAISAAFAMMPVMYNETRTIEEAQKSRALRIDYPDPVRKGRAYMALMAPILSISIQRAMNLAVAIESRGFSERARKRTHLRELRFNRGDWVFLGLLAVFSAFFIYFGQWGMNIPLLNYTSTVAVVKELLKILGL